MSKSDKDGKTTLLKMWTKAEDDQYGLLARDERLVDLAEDAIGKPIYLYSHKMTMKQPQEGGAWGMAPGFRLLVQLRLPCAGNDKHLCRA